MSKKTIDSLVPWQRNPRRITEQQMAMLKKSLAKFGDLGGIVFNRTTGHLVGGHQRIEAFRQLSASDAPEVVVERLKTPDSVGTVAHGHVAFGGTRFSYREVEWDEVTETAANIAANKHGGDFDEEQLAELVKEIDGQVDLALTGFRDDELKNLLGETDSQSHDYTPKINAGIYTPKGDRPPLSALLDASKTDKLISEIKQANLPEDIQDFLCRAADRHTVFHFNRIAEYYCHAPAEVQQLFEASGLVIVDFNKAIENGFVRLTEKLRDLAGIEEASR